MSLHGRGGHTSRPQLTEDLTYALAKVVTDVPAALSRRLDPRAGAALVWEAAQLLRRAQRGLVDAALRPMRLFHWSNSYLALVFVAGAVDPLLR